MAKAILNGTVIADSDDVRTVEGMMYFPLDSVQQGVLIDSDTTTRCFWKGKARYWHVQAGGESVTDGAFAYPKPSRAARPLVGDRVAFWRGVQVTE